MAWVWGTGATNTINSGPTNVTVVAGGAVSVGDLIAVAVGFDTGGGATSSVITDSLGNGYTRVTGACVKDTTNNEQLDMHFSIATHAGTPTLTVRFNPTPGTTTASTTINVDVATGSNASSALDGTGAAQVQNAPTTTPNALTSGSFTTTTDGSVVYTATLNGADGTNPGSVGTGFTALTTGVFVVVKTAWKTQATHGSTAGTWTAASNFAHCTGAFAVTPASGGGGRTFFVRAGLDGLSTSGPKQFNPTLG